LKTDWGWLTGIMEMSTHNVLKFLTFSAFVWLGLISVPTISNAQVREGNPIDTLRKQKRDSNWNESNDSEDDVKDEGTRIRPHNVPNNVPNNVPTGDRFFYSGNKIFPDNVQKLNLPPPPDQALATTKQVPDEYMVGPGDQFLINFWGRIEDNIIVSIDSEAKLFIPRLGVIDCTGKTYKETLKQLDALISNKMRGVSFSISLYKERVFKIYVLGAVNSPGPLEVKASTRAGEAIRLASGVKSNGSSQFIEVRRGRKVIYVNLLDFELTGNFQSNPFMTDSDVIFVPQLSDFVTISGSVSKTGPFEIARTKNLPEIIEILGGLTVNADQTKPYRLSRVSQTGERISVNIIANEKQRTSNRDVLVDNLVLQHGDEVFVPSSPYFIPSRSTEIYVTGAVKLPGPKPYRPSSAIEEYIGLSGGFTDRADQQSIVVQRSDGSKIDGTERLAIEPGDTIYIPERTFKFWQDHLAIVTTFLTLATSIIVLAGK